MSPAAAGPAAELPPPMHQPRPTLEVLQDLENEVSEVFSPLGSGISQTGIVPPSGGYLTPTSQVMLFLKGDWSWSVYRHLLETGCAIRGCGTLGLPQTKAIGK